MQEETRRAYLERMGIPVWVRREASPGASGEPVPAAAPSRRPPEPEAAGAAPAASLRHRAATLDWTALEAAVRDCTACGLHAGRTQAVFGVGDRAADWLIVGEAPGAEEDRRGEPFVGRAGKLLDNMLAAIGLARDRVYIANILKCRPPNNRDPLPEEVVACEPWLHRQIALIRPRIVLAVGRVAAQNLLHTDRPVGRLRGTCHFLELGALRVPVVVTYHPAYLLRSPLEKRKAWQDLQRARALYREARNEA
ncbi:MAG: uracil-DNA glycosylase [Gammaproteobacteria bacterium]|nr:MAG: uracil-DNA glycosylase [Gammaproteobacteria bacterium]